MRRRRRRRWPLQPAAQQMAKAGEQTRFVTAYAISQVVKEDGHVAPEETDYRSAILTALRCIQEE